MHKFQREAENLAKLDHPNIVKVLEVFRENNTVYYVMEYIDGGTLDDYIKTNGRLKEKDAFGILKDVGSALAYMHENKMLHLDLKPKNIMRNISGHIYLIDFGLSKQYNDNGEPESSTTLGLGTPGYAPLEQSTYKQDGSFPATLDVYALGGCLFKMLTGQTPPEAPLLLNDGLPCDLLKYNNVSDGTIKYIERSMSPIKINRFQSVLEMLSFAGKSISIEKEEQTSYDNSIIEEVQPIAVSVISSSKKTPIVESILSNMIKVDGGTFMMGATDAPKTWFSKTFSVNDYEIELPVHEVSVSSFLIGRFMVTIDEWETVMGEIPKDATKYYKDVEFNNKKEFPIHHITWDEGILFLKQLNSMSDNNFRLPTEAEWEYAARGGKLSNPHCS
jgi:serine/threonine protein kinase